jgi:hypothetical protein
MNLGAEFFLGIKMVKAEPMTRRAYNDYRGWELPSDEDGDDAGFLVEYLDGGKANMPDRKGYVSWSPADVFERSYRLMRGVTFGYAIEVLKRGGRVARKGWNGKGMWLEYVKPQYEVDLPYIRMSYPVNSGVYPIGARVPWLASQTDMLNEDWIVLP